MIRLMKLSEICTDIIDCPHSTPKWLKKGNYRVIRNFNIVDGFLDFSDGYFVDDSTYNERVKRAIPQYRNIVFSREAPVGKCALIPKDFKGCLGQRLVLLIVNESVCSPEYLLVAMQSSFVKQQYEQVEKSGSIVSNFNIGDLKNLIIPVIDNQAEVTEIVTNLNAKIALNNSICADLEAMTKLIYDYWFVQFDFPDEKGRPYKSSGGKMVWCDELKKDIPKDWENSNIHTIAELETNSIKPISNTDYCHYSIPAFDDNMLPSVEKGYEIESNKFLVPNDCVLVSKLNPQFKRIWLINYAVDNSISSTEFLPLKAKANRLYYLYSVLNSDAYSVHLNNKATASTGSRKRISPENCMDFHFPFNERVADKYNSVVRASLDKVNSLRKENGELTKLRDFLLPMLMNGQIKIGG